MAKYIVVDAANLFFRCRYAAQGDAFTKAGVALHILFRSLRKVWREQKADHVVFCFDGGSWRGEVYPAYKAHRKLARTQLTPREHEEEQIFVSALDSFTKFVTDKTQCTVLRAPRVEGDDFVARWIALHADDQHVILSGDSDFVQLLAPNVTIYDGMNNYLITTEGVCDAEGRSLEFSIKSDGKLKVGEANPGFAAEPGWWQRALFTKVVRGDSGDNVFSAYPRVRDTKLKEAFLDRTEQGYAWNNFMLQTWVDHDGQEVRVLDAYRRNLDLIDLARQPDQVKQLMDEVIVAAVQKPVIGNVGIHFLRFCDQHSLVNLSREAADHASYLNASYARA